MIADWMTWGGNIVATTRHGVVQMDESSPMKRCTFEQPVEVFYNAAFEGTTDHLKGISEQLMVGTTAKIGTYAGNILKDEVMERSQEVCPGSGSTMGTPASRAGPMGSAASAKAPWAPPPPAQAPWQPPPPAQAPWQPPPPAQMQWAPPPQLRCSGLLLLQHRRRGNHHRPLKTNGLLHPLLRRRGNHHRQRRHRGVHQSHPCLKAHHNSHGGHHPHRARQIFGLESSNEVYKH